MREAQDDGQAEDLVSDVHLRAQSASQAAVAAGLDQQQKVQPCCPPYLPLLQGGWWMHVSCEWVMLVRNAAAEHYTQS